MLVVVYNNRLFVGILQSGVALLQKT